jgi:hypothetical protein
VSPPRAATERYDAARHDTSQFQSGNETLDRWLLRYAGQSERRDAARIFVLTDGSVVIGYYALLAGELDHAQATEQTRKGMSRHYPIPGRDPRPARRRPPPSPPRRRRDSVARRSTAGDARL